MPQALNYAFQVNESKQQCMHINENTPLTYDFSDLHPHKTSFIIDRKKQNHFIYRQVSSRIQSTPNYRRLTNPNSFYIKVQWTVLIISSEHLLGYKKHKFTRVLHCIQIFVQSQKSIWKERSTGLRRVHTFNLLSSKISFSPLLL